MGFLKRNIQLEEYLDSITVTWNHLSDLDYKYILSKLNEFIDKNDFSVLSGDDAFKELQDKKPIDGFIFSAPKHKIFSIYHEGGDNLTFGYAVNELNVLEREKLNEIECIIANNELSFACMLNHEWQAHCPELYIEKNV